MPNLPYLKTVGLSELLLTCLQILTALCEHTRTPPLFSGAGWSVWTQSEIYLQRLEFERREVVCDELVLLCVVFLYFDAAGELFNCIYEYLRATWSIV